MINIQNEVITIHHKYGTTELANHKIQLLCEQYAKDYHNNQIEKQQLNTPNISINDVHAFLEWLNKQQKDYIGGEFLYDIKGYYKRLKQTEMFEYWLKNILL